MQLFRNMLKQIPVWLIIFISSFILAIFILLAITSAEIGLSAPSLFYWLLIGAAFTLPIIMISARLEKGFISSKIGLNNPPGWNVIKAIILSLLMALVFTEPNIINVFKSLPASKELSGYIEDITGLQLSATYGLPEWLFITSSILILLVIAHYFSNKAYGYEENFVPGAIKATEDQFGYYRLVRHERSMIQNSTKSVYVLHIDGRHGFGKSSFTRMLVEGNENYSNENYATLRKRRLYTVISYTEVNAKNDFSNLLASRMEATLSSRYPSLPYRLRIGLLATVLRSGGFPESVLRTIGDHIEPFDIPLGNGHAPRYGTDATRLTDFHIPTEKEWYIVIDEIDRALSSEIYQIIEVVERFRRLASDRRLADGDTIFSGLPLKVVLVLCMNNEVIEKFPDTSDGTDSTEKAVLVKRFFSTGKHGDPKAVDKTVRLIPSYTKMQTYVTKELYSLETYFNTKKKTSERIMASPNNSPSQLSYGFFIDGDDFIDPTNTMAILIYELSEQSPRTVQKYIENVRLRFDEDNRSKHPMFERVNIAYYLLFHYVALYKPNVLTVINKLMAEVYHDQLKGTYSGFHDDLKPYNDLNKVAEELEIPYLNQKDMTILRAVNHTMFKFISAYPSVESLGIKDIYSSNRLYSTTNPGNLQYMLDGSDETKQSQDVSKAVAIGDLISKDPRKLAEISSSELSDYVFTARAVESRPKVLALAGIELLARLCNGDFKSKPMQFRESAQHNAFTRGYGVIDDVGETDLRRLEKNYAPAIVDAILEPLRTKELEKVSLSTKVTIAEILVDVVTGAENASSYYGLRRIYREYFQEKDKKELDSLLVNLFEHGIDTYAKKSIYKYEENPFACMYQLWNGTPEEAEKLHKIAEIGLTRSKVVMNFYLYEYYLRHVDLDEEASYTSRLGTVLEERNFGFPLRADRYLELVKNTAFAKENKKALQRLQEIIIEQPDLIKPKYDNSDRRLAPAHFLYKHVKERRSYGQN